MLNATTLNCGSGHDICSSCASILQSSAATVFGRWFGVVAGTSFPCPTCRGTVTSTVQSRTLNNAIENVIARSGAGAGEDYFRRGEEEAARARERVRRTWREKYGGYAKGAGVIVVVVAIALSRMHRR